MKQVFSLFDKTSLSYNLPMFYTSQGEAMRGFLDIIEDTRTIVHRHPEDFSLYLIGSFDENSGLVDSLQEPKQVCTAIDLIRVKKETQPDMFTSEGENQ